MLFPWVVWSEMFPVTQTQGNGLLHSTTHSGTMDSSLLGIIHLSTDASKGSVQNQLPSTPPCSFLPPPGILGGTGTKWWVHHSWRGYSFLSQWERSEIRRHGRPENLLMKTLESWPWLRRKLSGFWVCQSRSRDWVCMFSTAQLWAGTGENTQ